MERPRPTHGKGFSLVEVLVAAAIMSSGLAGLSALLMMALSSTTRAADQAAAAMLADSMTARVLISPSAVNTITQEPPVALPPECGGSSACSAEEFAASGVAAWRRALASQLPSGQGLVCLDGTPFDGTPSAPGCDGAGRLVVKVFWSRYPAAGFQRLVRRVR